MTEAGKTFDQADPEVSEAVDFAHFYAEQALRLDEIDGATFIPAALTLVTPPWNFPVAIPAGSTLAALAAGSAVVLKPAGPAERCGAVLADIVNGALTAAGAPAELLALIHVDERTLGPQLIAHPAIDQVILTGAYETAELFHSFRPDLRLLAETSGKNAIIVTPSADFDLAVRDIVQSAYGHAGQKCSAASLVVLVGSVATSARFRRQLRDAIASLTVGHPTNPAAQMGPIIEHATGKLHEGLTVLGPGERWVLEPRPLDDSGRLWSPGLRDGVRRGSPFHRIEYFGPILGIMTADSLADAIDIVNDVDYGLTSGIHSLDPDEISTWLDHVAAGNLYVNRSITGAIVRRQPFGGWKRSAIGPGAKAGGSNHLLTLGSWQPAPAEHGAPPTNPAVRELLERVGRHLPAQEVDSLRRAAASYTLHWQEHFLAVTDPSDLTAERNLHRYVRHPGPVTIRYSAGEHVDLLRALVAAVIANTVVDISATPTTTIPAALLEAIEATPVVRAVTIEDDQQFADRLRTTEPGRVRLIGQRRPDVPTDVAVFCGPVTEAGRIELLAFVREQAVSITAHRFGNPDHLTDHIIQRLG